MEKKQTSKYDFHILFRESLMKKFSSKEKITYQGYRIFLSTIAELLAEKEPEFLNEILESINKNRHISDNEIIECHSFFIDESYYLQRIENNIYIFFWAEH